MSTNDESSNDKSTKTSPPKLSSNKRPLETSGDTESTQAASKKPKRLDTPQSDLDRVRRKVFSLELKIAELAPKVRIARKTSKAWFSLVKPFGGNVEGAELYNDSRAAYADIAGRMAVLKERLKRALKKEKELCEQYNEESEAEQAHIEVCTFPDRSRCSPTDQVGTHHPEPHGRQGIRDA